MQKKLSILIVGKLQGHNRGEIVAELFSRYDPEIEYDIKHSVASWHPGKRKIRKVLSSLKMIACLVTDLFHFYSVDIVYVPPMNYEFISYAIIIKRLLKVPIILDYYVFALPTLAESDTDACWIGDRQQCKVYDTMALSKVDYLINPVVSEVRLAAKMTGVKTIKSKVHVIPLAMEKLSYDAKIISIPPLKLAWWGLFSKLHGIEQILDAISLLKAKDIEIQLVMAGTSCRESYVVNEITSRNLLTNVCYRTDLSFANGTLPHFLLEGDYVALGHFGMSEKSNNVISNKIIESLSLGLPVLTAYSSGTEEFLSSEEVIYTEATQSAIAETIEKILDAKICLRTVASKGQIAFDRHFSKKSFKDAFRKLLLKVAEDNNV